MRILAAALAAVVAASSTARADGPGAAPEADRATELFATEPLALVARGVSLSYERLVRPRLSLVALGGFRAGAGGDYSARTATVGAEARWWPLARPARPMRRLYLGLHASAGHTSVHDQLMDVDLGGAWALSERVDLGWRFVAGRHLAITPALGLALREDVDRSGRLATTARPALVIGLELGWLR